MCVHAHRQTEHAHKHTHARTHTHTHRCGAHGALDGCQYKEEAANKEHFVECLAQTGSAQQQKHPSTVPLLLTNMENPTQSQLHYTNKTIRHNLTVTLYQ